MQLKKYILKSSQDKPVQSMQLLKYLYMKVMRNFEAIKLRGVGKELYTQNAQLILQGIVKMTKQPKVFSPLHKIISIIS
jgi:hypothetical protein